MKIELGAGERPAPGYLALDVNPRTASVVASALDLPFRSGTVTAMRAVDVAEHVSFRDTADMFAEWARVLAPGAPLYVQVPDALRIMHWFAKDDRRLHRWEDGQECDALRGAEWRLLGGHLDGKYSKPGDDFRNNAHYALFSAGSLHDALTDAGFRVETLVSNEHPNLLCKCRKEAVGR